MKGLFSLLVLILFISCGNVRYRATTPQEWISKELILNFENNNDLDARVYIYDDIGGYIGSYRYISAIGGTGTKIIRIPNSRAIKLVVEFVGSDNTRTIDRILIHPDEVCLDINFPHTEIIGILPCKN